MATFLDLSARGWMRVTVHDEVVTVTRLGTGSAELRDWESALMEAVFRGRSTAVLGEYDPNLESAWTYTGMTLVDRAEADGYRNSEAGQPDRRWLWFAGAGAILLVLAGAGFLFLDSTLVPAAGAALGLCLVVGSIAATIITPRTQTATSARFLSEVAGLRKVLGTESAASRQEFAQRSGLSPAAILATMLPYAVALGLEDAWVAAFPDLDADELAGAGLAVLGPGGLGGDGRRRSQLHLGCPERALDINVVGRLGLLRRWLLGRRGRRRWRGLLVGADLTAASRSAGERSRQAPRERCSG